MKAAILLFCVIMGIAIGIFIATNDPMKMKQPIKAGDMQLVIVEGDEMPGTATKDKPDTALVWYVKKDNHIHMDYLPSMYANAMYDSTMHLKQGEIDTLLHSKANY
jgi:hypothetical protein